MTQHRPRRFVSAVGTGLGIGLVGLSALFSERAGAQEALPPAPPPPATNTLTRIFNQSEVTSTGWALPLATLNTAGTTTLRTELGYADPIPGLYLNHKFAPGAGEVDAGFMNFSQMVFPLGDTLNFNSKGDLYSNGEQTGKQLGLRYRNTADLGDGSSLEYSAFAGNSVFQGGVSAGATADYRRKLGDWTLLTGASAAWLGERGVVALNGIGAVSRNFTFDGLPDGKFTTGLLLRDEFGRHGENKVTGFAEYQTHLVNKDGAAWARHFSALFAAYAGTQSHGGKVGLLYNPSGIGTAKKDFGVTFGPSIGWDSRQGGPQFNLELRTGF
jgi:hypothetical protein